MITKEMVKKALETSHELCEENGCLHADAAALNIEPIEDFIADVTTAPLGQKDPELALFFAALHVGYRLRMIEAEEPIDSKAVN